MPTSLPRTGLTIASSVALVTALLPQVSAAADRLVMPYVVVVDADDSKAIEVVKNKVVESKGTVVEAYAKIGVVFAYSDNTNFAKTLRSVRGVKQVGATRTVKVRSSFFTPNDRTTYTGKSTSAEEVPDERNAWDVARIGTDKAHKVVKGSSDILVGVIDSGVDDTHPDLKHAVDTSNSAGCTTGKATQERHAWRPDVGDHGTHVAGTVVAAGNDDGVLGVAPGVRLASVNSGGPDARKEFVEGVVCALVWAAEHKFKIANLSLYVDPWRFNCPEQADQAAILEAMKRAVRYAHDKGVLLIAAAGNESTDLANKTSDALSPNDGRAVKRTLTNDCLKAPTELPDVIAVSSVDLNLVKAGSSDYGTGKIQLAAPGVDIWSTLPGGKYGKKSGTSMAAPHVT